ncbi:hypothetical protein [Sutterella megalosphaeroides]|uniref:Uncharacterized protein n=1 Tax=Sutterella megalosphaeroides TaxID=2494234 RepID=A0A2Z6IEI8_9BURK|nr:hypothetical protein [Sutterella megalosphaeroides]BBF23116.1 hypothetical protein SUTMEG_10070 [Sutterella megalosphaeroides]
MTTRELRLFALLIVVALVALADLGWNFLSKPREASMDPTRPTPAHAQAAVNAIVPRIENDPTGFRALFATARRPIERPIVTRYEDPKTRSTLEGNLPSVTYTGFLALPDGAHAVINGTGYAVGDTVAETGERVTAISPDAVELFAPQTEARRTVLFTDELPAAYTQGAAASSSQKTISAGSGLSSASSGSSGSTASASQASSSELKAEPLSDAWSRLSDMGVVPKIREEALRSPAASRERIESTAAALRH